MYLSPTKNSLYLSAISLLLNPLHDPKTPQDGPKQKETQHPSQKQQTPKRKQPPPRLEHTTDQPIKNEERRTQRGITGLRAIFQAAMATAQVYLSAFTNWAIAPFWMKSVLFWFNI